MTARHVAIMLLLALAACGGGANTIGPYPATLGRSDCSFSNRVENGGLCPSIPFPTLTAAKASAQDGGCGAIDYVSNFFSCPASQTAPGEEAEGAAQRSLYCYKSLGIANCYAVPDDPRRTRTADPLPQ